MLLKWKIFLKNISMMIRRSFPILCFIGISFLLSVFSCDLSIPKKDDFASWTTKLEVPMFEKTITFEDIIDDSLINPLEESLLYAFTKSIDIDRVEVGDSLKIEDIQKRFSQNIDDISVEDSHIQESIGFENVGVSPINQVITSAIGTIALSDFPEKETDPYSFSSIFPGINDFPNGSHNIPGFNLEPVENSFSFDDFSSAEFTGGTLTLTIVNNLVIPLGETDVALKNGDGSDIINGALTISGPINPGESSSGNLSLNEINLPGNVIVEVTGSSPGADNVVIDDAARNSSFTVNVSGSTLEVSSATAKIPEQTIYEDNMILLSASDSNKVQSATILNGKLIILIDNNMAVSSTVQMNIPTIQNSEGALFETLINIPASESDIYYEIILNDHSLVMEINDQSVDYNYTVLTMDSGENMVTINSTDDIEISISLEGETPADDITFSFFTGRVAPQNLGFDGKIDVESESNILEANLGAGLLEILVENNVNVSPSGAPTAFITIPELENASGEEFSTTLENMSGLVSQSIDLSGYSILMTMENQQLSYVAEVTTNYSEIGSYSLGDSIFIDINVAGLSFDEVRGYFSQDAMVDSNSISIDDATEIETAELKSGQLLLDINNNIGIVADINFQILEIFMDGSILDTTLSLTPTGGSYIIDLSNHQLNLDMSEDPQTINYVSTITLPDNEEMTLSLSDSIVVDVTMTSLRFESVTGEIKPVTIEIEPVDQTIDGLPDEIEEFEFTEVEMIIDFDTNIGIPVILDLEIEASNSSGEIEISTVSGWDITADNHVVIPNAENLINIFPDIIRATGEATVSGFGTISASQYVAGTMTVQAPLSFSVPDNTQIETDIEETNLELDNEVLEEVTIFFDAENYFDFGTQISVYATSDSFQFGTIYEDTLFTSTFTPNSTFTDSIILDPEKIELFSGDKLFIKADVSVSGNKDENGNSIPSNVLTSDSLNLILYGRIEVLVDPSKED